MEPGRQLTLHFGMRTPGAGVPECELEPAPQVTTVTETEYWPPPVSRGRVHWYALVPLHTFIFKGMTRTMTERVKALPDRASASAA